MAFGIPNIERIVSKFLEGDSGITSIREIEFDKKYLWTIDFVDGAGSIKPPAPFDNFFPASDVSFPLGVIESFSTDVAHSQIQFPISTTARNLEVTFYDDDERTLLKWFSDWINKDILNEGEFISGIKDAHPLLSGTDSFDVTRNVAPCRKVVLALLSPFKKQVITKSLWVYPTGNLDLGLSQDSAPQTYTVSFAIVKDESFKGVNTGFSFDSIKEIIGRFI